MLISRRKGGFFFIKTDWNLIRFILASIAFSLLVNCDSFQYQRTVKLADGKVAKVSLETQETDSGKVILVVDYANTDSVIKESRVENDVLTIWKAVQAEADEKDIDEAVINYRYQVEDEHGHKEFQGLLFTADRTETGGWSVRKVE